MSSWAAIPDYQPLDDAKALVRLPSFWVPSSVCAGLGSYL